MARIRSTYPLRSSIYDFHIHFIPSAHHQPCTRNHRASVPDPGARERTSWARSASSPRKTNRPKTNRGSSRSLGVFTQSGSRLHARRIAISSCTARQVWTSPKAQPILTDCITIVACVEVSTFSARRSVFSVNFGETSKAARPPEVGRTSPSTRSFPSSSSATSW